MNNITQVTVIGSGTMGNGIAHVLALSNISVQLFDISSSALEKAMTTIQQNMERQLKRELISEEQMKKALENIQPQTSLATAVKDSSLVIEAATEHEETKTEIFKQLDGLCDAEAILASNTSSISITRLASATERPEKVIGMHFMNPVPVMPLVEVIKGYETSDQVTQTIIHLSKALGKTPLVVNDYPGFISNRILLPMINEAVYALQEGVSGVQEIDQIMHLGMAHPMGPLRLADFIGLDVCLAILKVMQQGFGNPKYAPSPLLVNMVAAGKLGVKSGEGFYDYHQDPKNPSISTYFTNK